MRTFQAALLAGLAAPVAPACGGGGGSGTSTGGLSGRIEADGSSMVGPYATVAAEGFRRHPDVQITIGISGTGGGFQRFCAAETDLSNASRPIKDEEAAECQKKGIDYVEFQIANDALTVAVNRDNDWADCLTVDQLNRIWEPGSKVDSWKDVDPTFPDEEMTLYGPGTDSSTFDFFTKEIAGEEGSSRSDYSASENDNVLVNGVADDEGALGYFGFSYYDQNRSRLKALAIDGGSGCVRPSVSTAQNGTYKPLPCPLFIYVKKEAFWRPEVEAFLQYILDHEREIAKKALFVPLTAAQLARAKRSFEDAVAAA
jgi:phosphate transport system substrate-binding protein